MRYRFNTAGNPKALSFLIAVFFGASLFGSTAFAATRYGAEIVDVMGKVSVTLKADGASVEAVVGLRLKQGDAIETGPDGEAEILFDDGNVTRMEENSRITIEKLFMEDDKSRKSVLGLAFGRVKNSVMELVHKESRFEVHTKSAVAGVRGTPHWIVGVFDGAESKTEVDLLGDPGEKGGVFVTGVDAGETEIFLGPGMRTVTEFGLPPLEPFDIAPDRRKMLAAIIRIKTPAETMWQMREKILEEVQEEAEEKPEQQVEPGEEEEGAATPIVGNDADELMEHVTRLISVGKVVDPNEDPQCDYCAKPGNTILVDDTVTPSSPSTNIRLNLAYQ